MNKKLKILSVVITIAVLAASLLSFTACSDDKTVRDENTVLRFSAPEGTPALAMLRLGQDNKTIDGTQMEYDVVSPSNIAVEMSDKKSDIVIMPVNAGANLIRQGADYKLVSIAVKGSLYIVGTTDNGGLPTAEAIPLRRITKFSFSTLPTATPPRPFSPTIRSTSLSSENPRRPLSRSRSDATPK